MRNYSKPQLTILSILNDCCLGGDGMEGSEVAKALIRHDHLWKAVLVGRDSHKLIVLRDLDNDWNLDTIWILVPNYLKLQLELVVLRELHPDDCEWLDSDETSRALGTSDESHSVLYCWWD